ncbi:MAG: phosphoglucosamine mutase [Phycisphaerae bacterium]|nr:phosphoglucosamine mutase [Phycisphaerae bacterium]
MAEKLIVSISGMRGIIGENLTPSIAAEYGCAFGSYLKSENDKPLTVCLGRDSRPSGLMLQSAVAAGLCAVGVNVIELGIVTTPGVGVMLTELGCNGGGVITASHNPIQYNGIKLLLGNAMAPPPQTAEKIKRIFLEKNFSFVSSVKCGKITSNSDTDFIHIEKVLKLIDKQIIASKKLKVVLDSVNGAGGRAGGKLLQQTGCEVVAINNEPTGLFAHTPEPLAENLTGLCDAVKQNNADIGFAQDPDADRLAIVDENGNYIGEEYTLALAAKYILSKTPGKAAANLSTSRMIDDIAKQFSSEVIRTAVGETNVAKAMIENNCVIGGEGNGGVIELSVCPIRDSLVAMALVLQLIAETGMSVSQLAEQIGGYYIFKDKFPADKQQADKIIEQAKDIFKDAQINDIDGCRFDFPDAWIHMRTSNTEPVMRVIVEAADKSCADKYLNLVNEIKIRIID